VLAGEIKTADLEQIGEKILKANGFAWLTEHCKHLWETAHVTKSNEFDFLSAHRTGGGPFSPSLSAIPLTR
jgi:hypothetical protein